MRADLKVPYGDFVNKVVVDGDDFKKVMKFLADNGNGALSNYQIVTWHLSTPAGEQDEQDMIFKSPLGKIADVSLPRAMNDPAIALTNLRRVFEGEAGDVNVSVPWPLPVPPPPPPVVNAGTETSDSPIGAYIPNTNGQYAIAYGWIARLKNGQTITDPETGANFVVSKGFSPMGPTGYLQLQGA